jgi:ubiquinone/menaquinone biosynthesis C-methylase UbiE
MRRRRVCPWWIGWLLASPVRRLLQDPAAIVGPYVHEGMTVLEPGPGMGFFTLELARRVGSAGRVVAVDLQPRMLGGLRRRAARAGLLDRLELRVAGPESLGVSDLAGRVDLAVAIAVVHEVPAAASFFREVAGALKPGGSLLLAEPSGHVDPAEFEAEIRAAGEAGLLGEAQPAIRRLRTALLRKPL